MNMQYLFTQFTYSYKYLNQKVKAIGQFDRPVDTCDNIVPYMQSNCNDSNISGTMEVYLRLVRRKLG